MKFMCFTFEVFNLFEKENFWIKSRYDTIDKSYYLNPSNHVEIRMSHLLLSNNINYVSLDKRGIINLNILDYYKNKDWETLFEINKKLYIVNDKRIIYRIFWSDNTMKKIFIDKNLNYINKLSKDRDVSKLNRWN